MYAKEGKKGTALITTTSPDHSRLLPRHDRMSTCRLLLFPSPPPQGVSVYSRPSASGSWLLAAGCSLLDAALPAPWESP